MLLLGETGFARFMCNQESFQYYVVCHGCNRDVPVSDIDSCVVFGNGCVIDIEELVHELRCRKPSQGGILVSSRAHILLPFSNTNMSMLQATLFSKMLRCSVRMVDLLFPESLPQKVLLAVSCLQRLGVVFKKSVSDIYYYFLAMNSVLRDSIIADSVTYLNERAEKNVKMLLHNPSVGSSSSSFLAHQAHACNSVGLILTGSGLSVQACKNSGLGDVVGVLSCCAERKGICNMTTLKRADLMTDFDFIVVDGLYKLDGQEVVALIDFETGKEENSLEGFGFVAGNFFCLKVFIFLKSLQNFLGKKIRFVEISREIFISCDF